MSRKKTETTVLNGGDICRWHAADALVVSDLRPEYMGVYLHSVQDPDKATQSLEDPKELAAALNAAALRLDMNEL